MAGLLMTGMAVSGMCVVATAAACTFAAFFICLAFVVVRLLMEAVYRIDWFIGYSGREPEDGQEVEG